MGKTIAQKIIEQHCDGDKVDVGHIVKARVDLVMGNDVSGPMAVDIFNKININRLFDPEKVVLVADHFVPNKDIKSAEQVKVIRDFAKKYKLPHYYENEGIEHALLPERGLVLPGQLIAGADSHTVTYGALGAFAFGIGATDLAAAFATGWVWLKIPKTIKIVLSGFLQQWVSGKDVILEIIKKIGVDGATYKVLEFQGSGLSGLPMESRFTISNMAAESGAKAAIFPVDEKTIAYIEKNNKQSYSYYTSDDDAEFTETFELDLGSVPLQVAFPHLPSNSRNVEEIEKIKIDQVVIGSCTNGWIEDLRVAGQILKGKHIASNLRLIIIPATREIYKQALKEGLVEIFVEAGAIVSPPTCGPCLGGFMGILAEGERALATTNRNFIGRMGHNKSEVYLSNPAVAAASAVKGYIVHPQEVVN